MYVYIQSKVNSDFDLSIKGLVMNYGEGGGGYKAGRRGGGGGK